MVSRIPEVAEAFGVVFHKITFDEIVQQISECIEKKQRLLIGYTNLHGAYLVKKDKNFASFSRSVDIHYADGMPLVIWRRLLWGDVSRRHRSTLSQTFPQLLTTLNERSCSVFYLGSEETVLRDGIEHLKTQHPGLRISGHHGFFDKGTNSPENSDVLEEINRFTPDILFVGFGMPLQERWIQENMGRLDVPVIYATGAAIEYFSSHIARPPAWISNSGFEWAFRMLAQPRKLWRRYLVEPWFLLGDVFNDIALRIKHRDFNVQEK